MLSYLRKLQGNAMRVLKNEEGQGLVEYALILVLIAIVVLSAVKSVGVQAASTYTNVNTALHN